MTTTVVSAAVETQPTAAENREWVRSRLRRERLVACSRNLSMAEAAAWLAAQQWTAGEVWTTLYFIELYPDHMLMAPGWRLRPSGPRKYQLLTLMQL